MVEPKTKTEKQRDLIALAMDKVDSLADLLGELSELDARKETQDLLNRVQELEESAQVQSDVEEELRHKVSELEDIAFGSRRDSQALVLWGLEAGANPFDVNMKIGNDAARILMDEWARFDTKATEGS